MGGKEPVPEGRKENTMRFTILAGDRKEVRMATDRVYFRCRRTSCVCVNALRQPLIPTALGPRPFNYNFTRSSRTAASMLSLDR